MKTCSKCKQSKSPDEFYNTKRTYDGKQAYCKECQGIINKGWVGSNEDRVHTHQMKYRYGISPVQYADMLEQQNGVCAVCGKTNKDGKRLAVDHDHETLEVRGLLCHRCNVALGMVDDDVNILTNLIEYILR